MTAIPPLQPKIAELLQALEQEPQAPAVVQEKVLQQLQETLVPLGLGSIGQGASQNGVQSVGQGAGAMSTSASTGVQVALLSKPVVLAVVAVGMLGAAGIVLFSGDFTSKKPAREAPVVNMPLPAEPGEEDVLQTPAFEMTLAERVVEPEQKVKPTPKKPVAMSLGKAPSPPMTGDRKTHDSSIGVTSAGSSHDTPVKPLAVMHKAPEGDSLAQERQLIEAAQQAYVAGQVQGALAKLALHRQRFADGQMAEERDAIEILCLADSGQYQQALSRQGVFCKRYPSSIFGDAIQRALDQGKHVTD